MKGDRSINFNVADLRGMDAEFIPDVPKAQVEPERAEGAPAATINSCEESNASGTGRHHRQGLPVLRDGWGFTARLAAEKLPKARIAFRSLTAGG